MSDKIRPLAPLVKGGRATPTAWRGDSCTKVPSIGRFPISENSPIVEISPRYILPLRFLISEDLGQEEVLCDESPRHRFAAALPPLTRGARGLVGTGKRHLFLSNLFLLTNF